MNFITVPLRKLISETISNILTLKKLRHVTKEKKEAIEQFFIHLYDYEWKIQQDSWILCDGLYKLRENNIKFSVIVFNLHKHYFSSHNDFIIDNKNPLNPWIYYDPKVDSPYPFHLLDNDEELLADLWYEYLTQKPKLI